MSIVFFIEAKNMRNWMLVLSVMQNGKIRQNDPGEVDGEPVKKKVPAKVMWYFLVIPHLKRFSEINPMLN